MKSKKLNNRHELGLGNGKFGKKLLRKQRAVSRPPRSFEERLATAGAKERTKLLHA